jgi:uncharacterized protein (DUF2126 family)
VARGRGRAGTPSTQDAQPAEERSRRFALELAQALGLSPDYVLPTYEDPWRILRDESNLPIDIDPLAEDVRTSQRGGAERQAHGSIGVPVGYVLPLKPVARAKPANQTRWQSSPWPLRRERDLPHRGRFAGGLPPAARLASRGPARGRGALHPARSVRARDALGQRRPSRAAQAAKLAKPGSSRRAPRAK